MIKVRNADRDEIKRIGTAIGEAFAAEQDGLAALIPQAHLIRAFEIMTECYYNLGVLYTTSEQQEGFLAYRYKTAKLPIHPALRMALRMIMEIPLPSLLKIASGADELYAKIYKSEPEYIAISMVVVLKPFQGKGFMRQVLDEPFRIAEERSIPCVLDTDTPLKAAKYARCGMEKSAEKRLKNGVCLYTMCFKHKKAN